MNSSLISQTSCSLNCSIYGAQSTEPTTFLLLGGQCIERVLECVPLEEVLSESCRGEAPYIALNDDTLTGEQRKCESAS